MEFGARWGMPGSTIRYVSTGHRHRACTRELEIIVEGLRSSHSATRKTIATCQYQGTYGATRTWPRSLPTTCRRTQAADTQTIPLRVPRAGGLVATYATSVPDSA
eukprot:2502587-Rhodomonas_salina.9